MLVLGYDPGSVHRWAGLLRFNGTAKPKLVAVYEVPECRKGIGDVLAHANAKRENGEGLVVAVETPVGVAYGKDLRAVKGRSKHLLATSKAADRFATLAWARGFRIDEPSAGDVRAALCHDASATDPMVKAVVMANVEGQSTEGQEHARDGIATALFIGAKLVGYRIVRTVELVKAKAKKAAKRFKARAKAKTPMHPAVEKAMREQGFLK